MRVFALTSLLLGLAACTTGFGIALPEPLYAKPSPIPMPMACAPSDLAQGTRTAVVVQSTLGEPTAVARFLSQALATPVRAHPMPERCGKDLAQLFVQGRVDVAYVSALTYVGGELDRKVHRLATAIRGGEPTHRAVLFSAAGSPLRSLEDLRASRGTSVTWTLQTTEQVFIEAELRSRGLSWREINLELFRGRSWNGPEPWCNDVVQGRAQLGASWAVDHDGQPAKVVTGCVHALGAQAEKLQIVVASGPIPNDLVVVRADLPDAEKTAISSALRRLADNKNGRTILAEAFNAENFGDVDEATFGTVRETLAAFE
ncbi:MAG: PhnD/SsuA/transferrin family substrate-binding protein [Deltaproteobacteria bacterium]|nr:PhnD/SsuA/transferrin family substrate-binding protein [Deltaproteobacteria bacterium]